MQIILIHPEIPANTGNIVRTCACTGASLTLVEPLGFHTSDRALKRAGLDYWLDVDVTKTDHFEPSGDFLFFSSKAERLYTDHEYTPTTQLIFGSESKGLPPHYLEKYPENFVRIPTKARCLNLSNAVAIGLYEAIRQTTPGQLDRY